MQLLFLSTLLAALSMPTAAVSVGEWLQCGGIGYTGATTCTAGFTCNVVNSYYSQCQPKTVNTKLYVPRYGQCGGIGWTGLTTCTEGSTCVFNNPHYSQCLP
ncbi:hypothetical protein SPRG_09802 [Saprolegnia parasitica CBS 223.65]|uniref:CBM1 domain-containing protein n=1 Tax=Saprolegnia parasitica (strain CBS 223.65) TaxID=695850 RepID=A0A067CC62_SAPPC|nr:hypothetical protein SPRG_09802 [Saprolegnia parasitica CBS 223.65]KDO24412.1 hypothetical protein SPRG_09802 [Saprolegnia parasitica CBS 223.65]|eukprot:XP_012204842.1 hypothetical protein SPRG_09802 [Saprolegnia parasitica CBS 223.65]